MRLRILPLLVFGCAALTSSAQPTGSPDAVTLTSVQEAIGFALEHNPGLDIHDLNEQKGRREVSISRSNRFPHISASFTGQYNRDLPVSVLPGDLFGRPGQTIETQFGQEFVHNTGITLSKTILDWSSHLKTRMAEARVTVTRAESELYRQQLSEQVAFQYFTALITRKALEIGERDQEIADSLLWLTHRKYEQGLVDRFAMNQARINANAIRQGIAESTSMHDQAVSNLKILLGLGARTTLLLEDRSAVATVVLPDTPPIDTDKELHVLMRQLDRTKIHVDVQRTAYLPKLSLSSYWGRQQFRDEVGLSLNGNDWSPYSYVGIGVSMPIFTGFANRNQIKVAKIERSMAERQLRQEQMRSEIRDQLLLSHYRNSLALVDSAYDSFQLWDENRRLAFQRYEQGLISLADYFSTLDDYLKAENHYLNALLTLYGSYSTILSRQ